MKDLVHRRPVVAFFALAYLGSWLGWSPWWLSESGIGVLPFRMPFALIALVNQVGLCAGPFAAALIVTRVLKGQEARGHSSLEPYRFGAGLPRMWSRLLWCRSLSQCPTSFWKPKLVSKD